MQNTLRNKFQSAGVKLIDAESVYFEEDTVIGSNVTIEPFVIFGKNVIIEDNVSIKGFSHIEASKIRSGSVIGPFARIRGGSDIGPNVQVGDFVEVKNSRLKEGSKANHLAYIGDSEVGINSNIGAGVITCNYDGFNKYKTTIGDDVFVGSNSSLVAPVIIDDGAIVGAGSVITKDIETNCLALARSEQKCVINGAAKFKNRRKAQK